MHAAQSVLVVGGTGRTGSRVVQQLLARGLEVRVVVRSSAKLASELVNHPRLKVTEASLLALSAPELQRLVSGCDAVISCLGHVLGFKGIFGAPRDLVTRAVTRLCEAIEAQRPPTPIKFIVMSSVSVHRSNGLDARRSAFERAFLWVLCRLVPPARDNQRAAEFLLEQVGTRAPFVEWVVIRPDTLLEGDVTPYAVHAEIVDSLFSPGCTNMANVAHVMCELVTNASLWSQWKYQLPVVVNDQRSTPAIGP